MGARVTDRSTGAETRFDTWLVSSVVPTAKRSARRYSSSPRATTARRRTPIGSPCRRSTGPSAYAYRDRRQKKRQFRSLWIVRINAASRENGLSYNRLISGLRKAGLELNRKILSEIAIFDPDGFAAVVEVAKDALEGDRREGAPGRPSAAQARPRRPPRPPPSRRRKQEKPEKKAAPRPKKKEEAPKQEAKAEEKAAPKKTESPGRRRSRREQGRRRGPRRGPPPPRPRPPPRERRPRRGPTRTIWRA